MENIKQKKGSGFVDRGQGVYTKKALDSDELQLPGRNKNPYKNNPNRPVAGGESVNTQSKQSTKETSPLQNQEQSSDAEDEPEYSLGDQHLVRDIEEAIQKEAALADIADNIKVTCENSFVTLEGEVSTTQEKMIAGDKAAAFAGFGKVHNNLKVVNADI